MTFLSFFLFKNKEIFITQFISLLKHKAEILLTIKDGTRFWVRSFSDLMIIRSIFGDEIYKPLFNNLKDEATFIDIGAYIGDSAVYAAGFPKVKKIISIEPLVNNLKLLRKNLKENTVNNVLVLEKAAASDLNGRNIYIYKDEDIASLVRSSDILKKVFVPTITLSEVIKLAKIKYLLLKCDIEGGEYELFLKTPLKILSKIGRLMIELHIANLKDKNLPSKLLSHLREAGFTYKIKRSFFNPKYPLLYAYRGNIK